MALVLLKQYVCFFIALQIQLVVRNPEKLSALDPFTGNPIEDMLKDISAPTV